MKRKVYAREGVSHLWWVDPEARSLEILRLEAGGYATLGVHAGGNRVRAEPFEALELDLALLWGAALPR